MTRLYALLAQVQDVATHFDAECGISDYQPTDIVEGLQGPVVTQRGGDRQLEAMRWGFPRITREMRERGEADDIIGLVADLTNPLWEEVVQDMHNRCLIPLTHFANPAGDSGEKTRTWFSVKEQPIVAWAGFWAETEETGPVYAGMTMTANAAVMTTNDRMPVLLERHEWGVWLNGGIRDVIGLQFAPPLSPKRMLVNRTRDRWRSGKLPFVEQLTLLRRQKSCGVRTVCSQAHLVQSRHASLMPSG
ncbi:SOS response-associated peptidase family protein [Novosphingobium sp. PS1R-30]|uniref:SOS response-associated peptidase family protein n=1 Tax=Novosphingobium anseongense TaxID=3133436 RepID=A0ABU8S2V4_9SPHN